MIKELETINVGIVGHIDHGKTTLLQKLSGKWTDTHSEELKRGITIKLGYADAIIKKDKEKYSTEKDFKGEEIKRITFVDAPGHEMLMATMLSGAAIMDAAILVVAANEGIKPQTQEHLVALKAKEIDNIIIVQNKIDLVSKEEAIENYKKIKDFVKNSVAENAKIIPVSAQQGINISKVLEEICKLKTKERNLKEKPIFMIARSFDTNRPGTELSNLKGGVLGGALKQGILKEGDKIEIKPGYSFKKQNQINYKTVNSKITSIMRGNEKLKEARPGGTIAIETELDTALTKSDALSGCICSLEGNLPEITENINIKFNLFEEVFGTEKHEKVSELKVSEILMLSINTSTTVGTIKKIKGNEIEVLLKIPVVPLKDDPVGIARNISGHWRLIGLGKIIS